MITFHEAELDSIDGYYYHSGRNDKIDNVIKNLYALRLYVDAQVAIKLLMNSMYRKTTIKPLETDTIIKIIVSMSLRNMFT